MLFENHDKRRLGACDISRKSKIDPSTGFPHLNRIVTHEDTVIQSGCRIMQQVILGQTAEYGVPVIEKMTVWGGGATVVGIPAKNLPQKTFARDDNRVGNRAINHKMEGEV